MVNGIDAARVNGPGDQAGQARILIVDDEAMIRALLTEILSQEGYDVIAAEDGEVAVSILEGGGIDLIITDIFMPEVEGLETLRRIMKDQPDQKIMVISGGGRSGYLNVLDAAMSLGAMEQIAKPFSPSELLTKVDLCLAAA